MTSAGCPIETPNVAGVGVRVLLSRPLVGPSLRLLALTTHPYFFSRLSFAVVVLLRKKESIVIYAQQPQVQVVAIAIHGFEDES